MNLINGKPLISNLNFKLYYNPFGGICDEELSEIILEKYPVREWIDLIHRKQPIIIQFSGKKGRGKTTHLRYLYQFIDQADIFFLDRNKKPPLINSSKKVIFIDSVHHIPMKQRFTLWRNKNTSYIITTHVKRNLEFHLAKRAFKTYEFKGISEQILEAIILQRITLSSDLDKKEIIINPEVVNYLIKKYNDDFRGILNFLFDNFKKLDYAC